MLSTHSVHTLCVVCAVCPGEEAWQTLEAGRQYSELVQERGKGITHYVVVTHCSCSEPWSRHFHGVTSVLGLTVSREHTCDCSVGPGSRGDRKRVGWGGTQGAS